ncbi:hypothetical protein M2132_001373 [Dysgonomonas sp. PH5-45]|uniref:PDZ domain-containing protein n=1 Tax=unclassified Dysgonomonas TaxID=2630389 RepID=UPI002477294A|nr:MULTISPECIES: PDZ domain-containing protein [unclassified Dysgonomonas]MDH6355036.1 hypothetical protein [Dysgonomonas sp. PH5-45]MDH6387936.1 hypothetical protein [Dysgonomonas sp. PH5-37]
MKQLYAILLSFIVTLATSVNAQNKSQMCHFGVTFEISSNPSWGYGEPVVLTVEPYSPAADAGIKVGDIIMEVNGAATYLRDYQTIARWMFDESDEVVSLTIRNMSNYFREYKLNRECNAVGSLSESDLATSFSFYSLENTVDRAFILPVQIQTNKNVDYSDYHTFDFVMDKDAPDIDAAIAGILEKALLEKGLVRDKKDPDFMIQTYYSFQNNVKYNAAITPKDGEKTWRYDVLTEKMVALPIISPNSTNALAEGRFVAELGVRFYDKKYIDPNKMTQIWDCRLSDYLTKNVSLKDYAQFHAPLLLLNFPYTENATQVRYVVSFKKYNYTGIHLDSKDMTRVTNVDLGSPAYRGGLRGGDVIYKIQGKNFKAKNDELVNAYKRFIIESMKYRDPDTQFTDANGYKDCMYWNKYRYREVARMFKEDIYMPNFSYLYSFERYVSDGGTKRMLFDVKRNDHRRVYGVDPEVRGSVTIRIQKM